MAYITDPETGESVYVDLDGDQPDDGTPDFMSSGEHHATAEKPTSDGPEFMDADWDDETPLVEPVYLPVEGSRPLLYAGESHMVYGEGGSGKSWLGYYTAASVLTLGGVVVIVDYESNKRTVRDRLKAMGVTKAQSARVAYWRVTGSLMRGTPGRKALDAFVDQHKPWFILLDSVAKSMGAAGMNESDNSEYIKWQQNLVEPWTSQRITSMLIDHTGHGDALAKAAGRAQAARGASAKKDQVSGASYFFETQEHWTRDNDGWAKLTCMKDREGHRKAGTVAATMRVQVANQGRKVDIVFAAPQEAVKNSDGTVRRTWYMEEVSKILEKSDEPLSGAKVEQPFRDKGKSGQYASDALKTLHSEGYVDFTPGRGTAKLWFSVKAYQADLDPLNQQPATGGGFGGSRDAARPDIRDIF